MKKFILKIILYTIVIVLGLELLVRIFHFHKDRPIRYLDEYNVEKWVPNQNGIWVTGNRRMNVGHYKINDFGYNSIYKEFKPNPKEKQIALVGDSFIQGFHQDYQYSIGQKLENLLNKRYKVLEFGYAGWDLADQLHMIKAYNHLFEDIEHVIIYMEFTTDLDRDRYIVSDRFALDTPLNRFLKKIKTVVYLRDIGLMDPVTQLADNIKYTLKGKKSPGPFSIKDTKKENLSKLNNFKKLIQTYGFDKEKNVLLLDFSMCPQEFLDYLEKNSFKTIDFHSTFRESKIPPTLIYDQHWNNHGRNIVAELIKDYLKRYGL